MSEPIIPAGAFAAMKAGAPLPPTGGEAKATEKAAVEKAAVEKPKESGDRTGSEPEPKKSPPPAKLPPDVVKDPKVPPAAKEKKEPDEALALPPAKKDLWKIKAAGREVEIDPNDHEGIKKKLSLALGADKMLKDASAMKKDAEEALSLLTDPSQSERLRKSAIGKQFLEVARAALLAQMREDSMSPEEIEAAAKENETNSKLSEYDNWKAQQAEREREGRLKTWENHYETRVIDALETGAVPKADYTIKGIVDYMENAVDHGYELDPLEAAKLVAQDQKTNAHHYMGQLTPAQLAEFLGDDIRKTMREFEMKQTKNPTGNPFPPRQKLPEAEKRDRTDSRLPSKEWKESATSEFSAWLASQR